MFQINCDAMIMLVCFKLTILRTVASETSCLQQSSNSWVSLLLLYQYPVLFLPVVHGLPIFFPNKYAHK
uniref:Uncharacterized protein n=1 Tax=Arundo donax TaxID=35708 RepID=A0A0A9DTQ0_ARUDO